MELWELLYADDMASMVEIAEAADGFLGIPGRSKEASGFGLRLNRPKCEALCDGLLRRRRALDELDCEVSGLSSAWFG